MKPHSTVNYFIKKFHQIHHSHSGISINNLNCLLFLTELSYKGTIFHDCFNFYLNHQQKTLYPIMHFLHYNYMSNDELNNINNISFFDNPEHYINYIYNLNLKTHNFLLKDCFGKIHDFSLEEDFKNKEICYEYLKVLDNLLKSLRKNFLPSLCYNHYMDYLDNLDEDEYFRCSKKKDNFLLIN